MLSIQTLANAIVVGLLLTSPTTALPWAGNTTNPTAWANSTTSPTLPTALPCQTLYPSEYRVMNSRYPGWDQSPLHNQMNFFMLLRQLDSTFQVASQVQFFTPGDPNSTLPLLAPNSTCHLQLQLPQPDMQTTTGPEPIFNVYQVEREAGVSAFWNSYEPGHNASVPVFAQVNGTTEALAEQWNKTNGLVDIGATRCNETLTWQMGMAFNGGAQVNYWDFIDVAPPLNPIQGFRVLTGC